MAQTTIAPLGAPGDELIRTKAVLALVAVGLLAVVAYASTPFNFWVGDDFNYLTPKGLDRVLTFFDPTVSWRAFYRPIVWSSWAMDYALWGKSPFGWHVTSIIIHVVTTLLSTLIALRLLGSWKVAVLTGALFAVHPAHTEAVAWINGRTDEGCGLFYVPTVLFFVMYLQRRAEGRSAKHLYILAFALAVCTLLSKETAVTVPLVLLLTDLLFFTGRGALREAAKRGRLFMTHLPFFSIVAAYVLLRLYLLASGTVTNRFAGLTLSSLQAVLDELSSNFLMLSGLWSGPGSPSAIPTPAKLVVVLAGLIFALAMVRWLGRVALYSILWTALTLLPTYNLFAVRYLYTPSFGVCLLMGYALWRLGKRFQSDHMPAKRWAGYAMPTLVLLAWGLGTIHLNLSWFRAGEEARAILNDVRTFVPETGQPAVIYFAGAPNSYGMVLLFNTGLPSAMSYVYPAGGVELHEVEQPEPDPIIGDALATPRNIRQNAVFLGYHQGQVYKYESFDDLLKAGVGK